MIARRFLLTFVVVAASAIGLAAPAGAAPGALKLFHYSSCSLVPTDLYSKFHAQIRAEPGVAVLDIAQDWNPAPTAAELAPYDGVIVDSECAFEPGQAVATGDALGTYQRAGGVVFVTNWAAWDPTVDANYAILGDWGANLAPFATNQNDPYTGLETATAIPSTPIFSGITSLTTKYVYTTNLSSGASPLLSFPSGILAVAIKGRAVQANVVATDAYVEASNSQWGRLAVNVVKVLGKQSVSASAAGTGTGSVTGKIGATDCVAPCAAAQFEGTTATLTATAAKGSSFTGWSGLGCTGNSPVCGFTVAYPGNAIVANFASNTLKFGKLKGKKLSLTLPNAGKLTVTGSGIKLASKTAKKAGKVTLTLKPKGSLKSKIAKSGSAKVKLKFSFKPTGAAKAVKSSKSYTFK